MKRPKPNREAEKDLLIGVGSYGIAATAILSSLLRALQVKGVFTDAELFQILDVTANQVSPGEEPTGEKFARAIQKIIREIADDFVPTTPH